MNKIKHQISPFDSFSPWEESFINLVRSFDPSVANKPALKRQYLTIDACKGHKHEKLNASRKELGRTALNLSKINLRSSDKEEQLIIQQRSTRYQGPRITFYSKMNPNCSERSKSQLNEAENRSLRHSFYENNQAAFVRDRSIKYLDILEDSNDGQKPKKDYLYFRSIYPLNEERDFIYARKKEDSHHNMRRLKILSNYRKLSHQH